MKKPLSVISAAAIMITAALCLSGCGKYSSHYNAVAFVHSNESKSAFMNFYEFEGRMVFRLRNKDKGKIRYSVSLKDGDADIFYDCGRGKAALCSVKSGDNQTAETGELDIGAVYIIVETNGKCMNGEFSFKIEDSPAEE